MILRKHSATQTGYGGRGGVTTRLVFPGPSVGDVTDVTHINNNIF